MRLIATSQGMLPVAAARRTIPARRGWISSLGAMLTGELSLPQALAGPAQITASQAYIGELMLVGFNFAPVGWLTCDGRLLNVNDPDYQTLFTLIGTQYGGDGTATFALPDLRGRVPKGQGQGTGLGSYSLGQNGGAENNSLVTSNLPAHQHGLNASTAAASSSPVGSLPAPTAGTDVNGENVAVNTYVPPGSAATEAPGALRNTGAGQALATRGPSLALNYCICYQGIYPSF